MALTSAYKYKVYSGTAGAGYVTVALAFPSRWLDIYIFNNPATIRFQLPDGTYGDEAVYDPTYVSFPIPWFLQTRGFMIRNTVPTLNADYQIIPNV